jgi:hypothetical protein
MGKMNSHQPLETSQSTQHGNTDRQTVPQSTEANLAVYARYGGHCTLASYPSLATDALNSKEIIGQTYPSVQHSIY